MKKTIFLVLLLLSTIVTNAQMMLGQNEKTILKQEWQSYEVQSLNDTSTIHLVDDFGYENFYILLKNVCVISIFVMLSEEDKNAMITVMNLNHTSTGTNTWKSRYYPMEFSLVSSTNGGYCLIGRLLY